VTSGARLPRTGENPLVASGDTERTRLANERTYLAWWRTGIAGVAAGFAVGHVVPEVSRAGASRTSSSAPR
jgi:uncharacterized membrane protein YidH (DUF202 family)